MATTAIRAATIALAAWVLTASGRVEDWSTRDLSYLSSDAEFAFSRAICAHVLDAEPPAADLPTVAERKALKDCDSEALYFGIGMPADPAKARRCAAIERLSGGDLGDGGIHLLDGAGMLMTVYANGRGATRNFDVAIHMACQLDDAPAAMDFRIKHLAELQRKHWTGSDFNGCDDITSGESGGVCAEFQAKLARQVRAARIARLGQRWTVVQRALFDRAYTRFADYAGTAHDMDCFQGTAHAQCQIGGQEDDTERFLKRVELLAAGRPVPKDEPKAEDGVNPATDSTRWKAMVRDMYPEDRGFYENNRTETIAKRARFETALIAFAKSVFPRLAPHEVRAMFADL